MHRRIHFAVIVLSFIPAIGLKGAVSDVAGQLAEAGRLANANNYEQAEQLYKAIAAGQAGTDYGLEAQEKLTCLYATWGKEPEARAGLEKLLADYSRHERIAAAVTHVADTYRARENHQRACEIYADVIAAWPEDEHAMWSQMGLTISYASLGNDAAAQSAFALLRSEYTAQEHISRAVCLVGDHYRRLLNHGKACELYEDVLANWPDAEFALWARMGEAISKIRLGEKADETVSKLVRDFADASELPAALCSVGDEYRRLGIHNGACELYGEILERHPESEQAFWAQQNTAISKIWLQDYSGAEDAVEKVLAFSGGEEERIALGALTIADEYRKAEKYDEAFELYEYMVENHGDTKEALWSQMNLAIWKVRLGDPNADGETDKLLADYSADSDIAAASCWVADQYRQSGRDNEAVRLYQRIVRDHPESEYAMWSQMGLAISSIKLGNEPNAQDALASVLASYGEQNGFGKAVSSIASQYYIQKDFAKWSEVYETVLKAVETVGEEKKGLWTRVAEAVSNVHLGNDEVAQTALDRMIADFNDHPDLPLALWQAADAYYYNGSRLQGANLPEKGAEQLRKVIELGRRIREKLPATDDTVEAWFFAGEASSHIGEYEQAKSYFQKVVDMWPEHSLAASAQYQVGQTYKFMMRDGRISDSQERQGLKEAYEKVVENYPESYLAEWAGDWLEGNAMFFTGGQE